ncbi:MAG: ATP-binding cassette domain-containing protein, partial [Actinomycetota bacterium]
FQISETLRTHFEMGPSDARVRAIELLAKVEIPNPEQSFDKYPHQLSGGQRQRAMIAQSLACDPAVLIADEPTTALDVTVQAQILELISDLRKQLNMAMVIITHDLGVVANHTDRVAVMYAGELVELAETKELFARPRMPYT